MTEKQYRLNKWGTRLLKNNRPLFDWTNEADEIVDLLNKLNDKNEQLRKDATTLIYANQDYRHENEQLKQELFEARKDYLIETADISDKLYLDEIIEKERKEIFE